MKIKKQLNNKHIYKFEIRFSKSYSKYFESAVYNAKNIPGYKCVGSGKNQEHIIAVNSNENNRDYIEQICKVFELVYKWKNTTVSFDGKKVNQYIFFEDYRRIHNCYKQRSNELRNDDFCIGKNSPSDDQEYFVCLNEVGIHLQYERYSDYPFWWEYGELSKDLRRYNINKQEIFNTLYSSNVNKPCTLCPFFSWQRIEKSVNGLPQAINLETNKLFEIKYSEIDQSKPIGIKRHEEDGGYIETYWEKQSRENTHKDLHIARSTPDTKYSDIAAQDDVIEEVENVIGLPLKHPEYYSKMGVEPHKGILLYGPPGNGKTLIAKAVANEANAHFELINGPEILSMWCGKSEENLRSIFNRSKLYAPSIILIDEIDSVFSSRDKIDLLQHQVSLISQFLVLLDGLETRGKVMVIGTTNRIEAVDHAIRRPGRFDYHIKVPLPNLKGIVAILEKHLSKSKKEKSLGLSQIAQKIDGFSGAEIAALCREAGLIAIKNALKSKTKPEDVYISKENLIVAIESIKAKRF